MASAWGSAWGDAWGVSWGDNGTTPPPSTSIPTGGGGRWWSSYGDSRWDRKPQEVQITVKKKKKPRVVEVTLPEFNAEGSLKSLEQIRRTMELNRRVEKMIQQALDDEEVLTIIFQCL